MIRLPDKTLPNTAQQKLTLWQKSINALADFQARTAAAERKFASRNTPRNPTFKQVRATLALMCSGARRCCYCEDSCADEVEHIKPKSRYPEEVFIWDNFLYACGLCNGPKNNKFAVFAAASGLFTPLLRDAVTPPVPGEPVLINPRREDPLEFFGLDLLDTFEFRPRYRLTETARTRANYTIETLDLNRDVLKEAREIAYEDYASRLEAYIRQRDSGAAEDRLQRLVRQLQRKEKPAVWREMQRRQHLLPDLQPLFAAAPEALQW